jgi:heme a synthase
MNRFARFAWGLLGVDVAVVAWGAYVRATGSGAGCGAHWPLCNGEVVPRSPPIDRVIELSHRLSSGLVLVLTGVLLVSAFRAYPREHVVRKGAAVAMGLMLSEALIGAGLVLFQLVAHDDSMKRAMSVSLHMCNTFLLLGATALTAWWASGGARLRVRGQGAVVWALGVPLAAMLLVGVSGTVNALGDTLFPPASLAAGLAQDFTPGVHLFVRLRTIHPILALATGAAIVVAGGIVRALRPSRPVRLLSRAAAALVVVQVAAGLLDVALLAPVWLQLVHLVLADGVWILLLLTTASALGVAPASAIEPASARRQGCADDGAAGQGAPETSSPGAPPKSRVPVA